LLAKDADDRFASAAAFRDRLHEVQAGGGADPLAGPTPPVRSRSSRSAEGRPAAGFMTPVRRRWTVIAAVALVLVVLVGYGLERVLAGPSTVALVNVVGRPLPQAKTMLKRQGFHVKVVGGSFSSRIKSGHVFSESPAGGTKLVPGYVIELVTSKGPSRVAVPSVLYEDVNTAESSLKAWKLVPILAYVHNSAPANEVISQTPKGDVPVLPGSKVDLLVSLGPVRPKNATVPNVTGDSTSQAAAALSQVGLTLASASYQYSTQAQPGVVIDQNPGPYGQVGVGGSVAVVLSSGLSPQSTGLTQNTSQVSYGVPSTAPPNSVLKTVITDQAGNMEVFWAEVQPNETVPLTVTWYGQQGQASFYLNNQLQGTSALTPTSPSTSSPSSSSSSAASGNPSSSSSG
ncbi:MAG: PASTA domain-containing protein, partial [Clostridia bacterium]